MDQEFMNAVRNLLTAMKTDAQEDVIREYAEKVNKLLLKAETAMPGPRFRPEGPFHMYDTWGQCYWVLESHKEVFTKEN